MKRWPTNLLGNLIAIEKGKKSPQAFPNPTSTSVRYLQIDDLRQSATVKYCEPFNCPTATNLDVILAWDGANAGIASCNLEGHIGSTLAVLRPMSSNVLSANFLSRFLQSQIAYLQRTATGATIPHISKDALNSLQIPLPPLAEQERIVNLLEEADMLRTLRNKADRRTAALIPALFHEMFGDPIENPKKCKVVRLDEVTTRITDGVHSKPNYTTAGVPFISVKNITTGKLQFDDCKFISAEDHAKFTKRCRPEYLDILYTKVGATYGRPALVDSKADFSIYVSVCLIKPRKDMIDPRFLEVALGTPAVKNQADRSIKGIGVPDLHLDQIQNFVLPLPSLAIQKEFAGRVAEIRDMQTEQAASRRRLDDLFQSMLHRAFRGELVPTGEQEFHLTSQLSETRGVSRRTAIACYIVDRLHASPTFGRTQLMKGLYLTETYAKVDLHGEYERQAAGPFDKSIYDIEGAARAEKGFVARETRTQRGHLKISYSSLNDISGKVTDAAAILGKARKQLDYILGLFEERTTQEVEVLTTLYAAWNDLLIAGRGATDDDVVDEVLLNWHEDKKKIPESRWRIELQWMRKTGFVPTGFGRATLHTK